MVGAVIAEIEAFGDNLETSIDQLSSSISFRYLPLPCLVGVCRRVNEWEDPR